MAEKPKDLESMWRDALVDWERNLNAFANKAMSGKDFTKTLHQSTGASMSAKSAFDNVMKQNLAALNVPHRDDIEAMGQRLQTIEDDVKTIKALLYKLTGETHAAAEQWPKPSRTKTLATTGAKA